MLIGNGHHPKAVNRLLAQATAEDSRLLRAAALPEPKRAPARTGDSGPKPKRPDRETVVGRPVLVNLADVEPEPIRWLWSNRIPLGKLSLIVGDPDQGKSLTTLDFTARVTRGRLWPDNAESTGRGGVVLLSAEDDPADTIRPRLDAANADPARVALLQAVEWYDTETKRPTTRPFNLTRDLPALREAVEGLPDCRMVVIDPVSAYMGRTDSHRDADVRGVLAPLAELAARHRVAVLGVMHLNKKDGPARYRVSGSLGFVAASRAVWAVGRDRQEPGRRLFLPVKCNLAPDLSGLAFHVVQSGGQPIVAWAPEPVAADVDDVLNQSEESGERADAAQWLRQTLADGPVRSDEIPRLARQAGFAMRTLNRAKKAANVESYRDGFQGKCYWRIRPPRTTQQGGG